MNKNPLISVIIPVYNTSEYLARCLDSIIDQTYKNLQIICVNDNSPDNCSEILDKYKLLDERIVIVNNKKNLGLYHARLEGIKVATGDYLAFVDSDDYISCDYYRCLIDKANENDPDIVFSKIIHENSSGEQYIHNLYHYLTIDNKDSTPLDCYLEQRGRCFVWHTVWNKLYKKSLWDKALPYLNKLQGHLIMTEDLVFSSVLFYFAKKISSVEYSYHFYFQHSGASTSANGDYNKYHKNITDLIRAFKFVYDFYKSMNISEKNMNCFIEWEELYSRFWNDNIDNARLNRLQKAELFKVLREGFGLKKLNSTIQSDHYFYSITTNWDNRYYLLQEYLAKSNKKFYSFDIFDTAVLRPFVNPTDIFYLLDRYYHELFSNNLSFVNIRIASERMARQQKKDREININEIYEFMSNLYGLDLSLLTKIKEKELELEFNMSYPRNSILNLYKMLIFENKKVVFISDMYLDRAYIEKLLKKNGYGVFDSIFVSSEYGETKQTGNLYKIVARQLCVKYSDIYHIGDNWHSDIDNAQKYGIETHFYPKTTELFKNCFPNNSNTELFNAYFNPSHSWLNIEKSFQFLEVRCALAICANKLCDNPYSTFKKESNLNCNSQYIGYFPVGMFLLGVTQWIHSNRNKYNNIHFIGRDGYLFQKAYEQMYHEKTNYVELSRKALIPLSMNCANDIYSLGKYLAWNKTTPRKVLNALKHVLVSDKLSMSDVFLDSPFDSEKSYMCFLDYISKELFSNDKKKKYFELLKGYFSSIFDKNDVLFDVGYSGRSQILISKLLGYPLHGLYVHINDDENLYIQKQLGIRIQSFYNFTPSVTGSQREYLFSKLAGSLIEFLPTDNGVKLINESFNRTFADIYCIREIQDNALEFVSDFNRIFNDYLDIMICRNIDISIPFEQFIHNSFNDLDVFNACVFEDELFDGRSEIVLSNIWRRDISYHYPPRNDTTTVYKWIENPNQVQVAGNDFPNELFNKFNELSKVKKALIYFFCDNKLFRNKVKNRLKSRKKV